MATDGKEHLSIVICGDNKYLFRILKQGVPRGQGEVVLQ